MSANYGVYTAPNRVFVIAVPPSWRLIHGHESLELLSASGDAAILVTYYRKTGKEAESDARVHLKRFLAGQDVKGKARTVLASSERAVADFADTTGKRWRAMFCSGPSGLLLATSTYAPGATTDATEAKEVLDSIEVGGR
ncbi:MAG: hypothetical protein ACR2IF_17820 [Terriglobales bacterium]